MGRGPSQLGVPTSGWLSSGSFTSHLQCCLFSASSFFKILSGLEITLMTAFKLLLWLCYAFCFWALFFPGNSVERWHRIVYRILVYILVYIFILYTILCHINTISKQFCMQDIVQGFCRQLSNDLSWEKSKWQFNKAQLATTCPQRCFVGYVWNFWQEM